MLISINILGSMSYFGRRSSTVPGSPPTFILPQPQQLFVSRMSLYRDKWSGYLTTGLVAFTSGITLYLLISDTARRSEIRRRKNAITILDDEISGSVTALGKARHRFGVLRIGGRFVNPFDEYLPSNAMLTVGGENKEPGNG